MIVRATHGSLQWHRPNSTYTSSAASGGWTNQSIRAAALKIKADFPEMPGMGMYGEATSELVLDCEFLTACYRRPSGEGDVALRQHGDTPEQRAFEAYTAELMLELYPDPPTRT